MLRISASYGVFAAALCGCSSPEGAGTGNLGGQATAGSAASTGGSAASTGGSAGATSTTSGGAPMGGAPTSSAGATTSGGTSASSGAPAGGAGSAGSAGNGTGGRSVEATCTRWKADTANLAEGTWSGAVDGCTPGDISADGRANALRLFNLVRWLADLPAVATEPARDQQAQACALMMTANRALSHMPPMDWKCYTELGAKGASTSNISSGPGVASVLAYMVDDGNETTFGHRRIILANELGPIGLGSAGKGGASCMQNIGGTGDAKKAWTAWPPPGAFPLQAYTDAYDRSLDETGWSIQSKAIDLAKATVAVTAGGQAQPVEVEQLTGNYGNNKAIRILPSGWKAQAGQSYSVSVAGISTPIAYEFQLIDCK